MRIWRVMSVFCLSFTFLTGFAAHAPTPSPVFTKDHVLKPFRRIEVSGAMHVLVDQLKELKNPVATVRTTKSYPVTLSVKNHTLYVSSPDLPHQYMPFVHLRIRHLNWLTVNNHVSIVVRHTSAEHLQVIANDFADVSLIGLVDINQIQQNDQSKVNVQWVDSDSLTVNLNGRAHLTLAGATNILKASAKGEARVKAQYLRANVAWVKAENTATIFITPIKMLSAFASNAANVYYYKTPHQLDVNTTQSGNVLQADRHY